MNIFVIKSSMRATCGFPRFTRGSAVHRDRPAAAGHPGRLPHRCHLFCRRRCDTMRPISNRWSGHGTLVQEGSAGAEARRRRDIPRRRNSGGGQGAAAVRRELCGRLPGRTGVASARRHGRRRGHHVRARRPPGDLHQRGLRRRHAGRLDQLSAARRGDLEIGGRHQCGGRRAVQPRLARRDRRRDDHHRRGLRRRRQHHPGALLRLCAQIVDVAARSAARSAHHRALRGEGFRTLRGDPRAGDAGAAHPRLPCHRRVRRQEQPRRASIPGINRLAGSAALRIWAAVASAGHVRARAAEGGRAAAGGAEFHPRAQAQRDHPGRARPRSASS